VNALLPLVDSVILGMTRSLKFSDLKERYGFRVIEGPLNTQELNHLELYRSVVILTYKVL